MPASMAARVEQNLTSYFELWVELGCSWGAVEAHEERLQQQTGESDEGYSWMYGFQVKAEFPKSLADGWIRSLKNDPERYIPDEHLPDDDDAAMFKIIRSKTEHFKKKAEVSQRVNTSGNVGAMGSAGIQKMGNIINGSGELNLTNTGGHTTETAEIKTPEQLAAEEEEKQRKADERKAAQSDPMNRCKKWLEALPKDITAAKRTLQSIHDNTKVPEEENTDLKNAFEGHIKELGSIRDKLEDALVSNTVPVADLNKASARITKMRQENTTWKEIVRIYDPETTANAKVKSPAQAKWAMAGSVGCDP